MRDTLLDMPRKKGPKSGDDAKGLPPSRGKLTYTAIPKEYGDILKGLTEEGEEYEGRSVMFLTKLAVRAFLQGKGKLDAKGKPIG